MIREKANIRRLKAFEVLNNPILFTELTWKRLGLVDPQTKKPWRVFECRGWPLLCSGKVSHYADFSGRNQSKSEQLKAFEIKHFIIRTMLKRQGPRQAMFLAPNEIHQLSLSNAYVEMVRDPVIKEMIEHKKEKPFTLRFVDGSVLHGLIPGVGGRNLPGHHVDEVIGEESCLFSQKSLFHLGGCKNPDCTEHYYGTKTGDRSCPMYKIDKDPKNDHYRRFSVPSTAHPHYKKLRSGFVQDFGEPGSIDFVQNVLARWGQPTNWAFNENDVDKCFNSDKPYEHIALTADDVIDKDNPEQYLPVDAVLRLPRPKFKTVLGGWDVGYQEDSEIVFWGSNDDKNFQLCLRITMKKIRTEFQVEVLDRACTRLGCTLFGMDIGGQGATAFHLLSENKIRDLRFDYKNVIVPTDFSAKMKVGERVNEDGQVEEIVKYTKDACVDIGGSLMFEKNLVIPDLELKADLQSYRYSYGPGGRFIYTTIKDHLVCAFLAFCKAHFVFTGGGDKKSRKPEIIGLIPVFGD